MLLRSFATLAFACVVSGLVPVCRAQGSGAANSPPPPEARDLTTWLTRIHEAANRLNFQGTYVVSASGIVSSSRIAHYCDGRQQWERIEALDGQMRRVFRHNETVQTVWPSSRVALVEQRDSAPSFPSLLQGKDIRFVDHYQVRHLGADRVAGYETEVLYVQPKDNLRFGYRLWAEKSTGLLLRAEVLGERDEVLESAVFSDLAINVRSQPETVQQPMKKLDGFKVLKPVITPTRLDAEGWVMRVAVPGFHQINCVRRPIESLNSDNEATQVVQTTWSDGLTTVSVFIEPYRPERHAQEMQTSIGATQTLMRRKDAWWITVMGDVPVPTLKQFAKGIERAK